MWLLRERLNYFRVKLIALYMCTQKIANIFNHIQDHSRLGLENKSLENKSGRIFLRSTGVLYKFLPTNLGVCKPTFYIFYHTDLGQNAVFHNFLRQIARSQYSGRSIMGFLRNHSKHFRNQPYAQTVLISIVQAVGLGSSVCHELS